MIGKKAFGIYLYAQLQFSVFKQFLSFQNTDTTESSRIHLFPERSATSCCTHPWSSSPPRVTRLQGRVWDSWCLSSSLEPSSANHHRLVINLINDLKHRYISNELTSWLWSMHCHFNYFTGLILKSITKYMILEKFCCSVAT